MHYCHLGTFFLFILAFLRFKSFAFDYCKNSVCASHLACNNAGEFGSSCNGTAEIIDMEPLKAKILNKLNKYRNKIAGGSLRTFPPAAKMGTVHWSDKLASLALLNVKTCLFKHDKCFGTVDFPNPGQNLSFSFGQNNAEIAILQAIDNWFAEEANAPTTIINAFTIIPNVIIGHFTAMVNQRNCFVGCGALKYLQNGSPIILFTCNFPCNNFLNSEIYESAQKSATKCETGTDSKYMNLCSVKEVYDWQNCNI